MGNLRTGTDRRKIVSVLVAVVIIIIGFLGVANIIINRPTTYHYEEWLPDPGARDTRFTIAGLDDANISISFANEPGLWYRLELTHYSSIKKHAVNAVEEPSFLPLRVHVTSVTPVKSLNIVLGTDVAHSLYIHGDNLNAVVIMDNEAKISGSRCIFYGTGAFQFVMTENVNFTSEGMDVRVGDLFAELTPPDLAVFDIDLPPGLNGRLISPNMTFIQNEWPIVYPDQVGTVSIEEPLLDIEVYHSLRVWADLKL